MTEKQANKRVAIIVITWMLILYAAILWICSWDMSEDNVYVVAFGLGVIVMPILCFILYVIFKAE